MRRITALDVLMAAVGAIAATDPPMAPKGGTHPCDGCMMRTEEWNDGGFCYMFKNDQGHRCHAYERIPKENKHDQS